MNRRRYTIVPLDTPRVRRSGRVATAVSILVTFTLIAVLFATGLFFPVLVIAAVVYIPLVIVLRIIQKIWQGNNTDDDDTYPYGY